MTAIEFGYRAVDNAGKRQRGTVRAPDRDAAYRKIVALGLVPVSMHASRTGAARGRSRKVRVRDVAQFTYQLGVMIEARIPIADGLTGLAEQESNENLRRALMDIAARVQAGQSIASSLAEHRLLFGTIYIESIHAAERTGNLVKVLAHLSEMLERMDEASRAVKSALMYPAVVVSTLSLATTFLVAFAVPKFARMFAGKGLQLPFLTRAMMAVGESVQHYWWAYIAGLAAAVMCGRRAWRLRVVRTGADRLLHRVPVINQILRGLAISRFSRVFGLSLASGIGLLEALDMAGRSSGRRMLQADTEKMIDQVRGGGQLSDVLNSCAYIPTFAKRMFAAGEQSGELPKMCDTVARQFERETAMLTKNIGVVIEPVLIVLIAGVVLVVALAIFLPMWDMARLMS